MATSTEAGAICLFESVIRGHHIYKSVWTPSIGEILEVEREPDNIHDVHALSVQKTGNIVGHIPREVSRVFSAFLLSGGNIDCEVTGHRKYGRGLEVPCIYKLTGEETIVKKAKKKN